MKTAGGIGLDDVRKVYSGFEGRLWELIMGEQIHIGGLSSSIDLAAKAGITHGMQGVDLCCCSGAGMRFLVKLCGVQRMLGIDATEKMVELGRHRCETQGFSHRIDFILADACRSGLKSNSADFIWGEDAWCYVEDKQLLISEACRIVKPGGRIAFTDWVEGPSAMSEQEAERFLRFMKFPSLQTIDGYRQSLSQHGCTVVIACDTGRFAPCIDLYINMLGTQLSYDALKIVGFDQGLLNLLAGEMAFTQRLAKDNKIIQGMFVAEKRLATENRSTQ